MIFDVASFGMGLGLVMTGWCCGMVASIIFALIRRLGWIV